MFRNSVCLGERLNNRKFMISYLKGKIKNKGTGYVIIIVRDVGYKIFVNEAVYSELAIDGEAELYIYQHVREDSLTLFGFYSIDQLEMFELLIGVSGIGPKSALGVLAVGDVGFIKDSIAGGDVEMLTKVSGIGKKTAERVVLELRDKIVKLNILSPATTVGSRSNADEMDALMTLGYSMQQAREALKVVDASIKDSGERIREALKNIA